MPDKNACFIQLDVAYRQMSRRCLIASVAALTLLSANVSLADLLTGVSATATSELISGALDRAAIHTVDGSGLTGLIHATSGEGRFWESIGIGAGFGVDRAPAITLDLRDFYLLESLRVWNFAEANSAVRRANLSVSLDGFGFTSLGIKTFVTPVNPAQDHSMNNAVARFVRLDILENGAGTQFPFLSGNPTSSGFVGLGEVQFFGSAVPEPPSIGLLVCSLLVLLGVRALRCHRYGRQ